MEGVIGRNERAALAILNGHRRRTYSAIKQEFTLGRGG